MRQSILFTKTQKDNPSDEVSKNAIFLIRGGFVHKDMSGVYSYLPLGMRVLQKIINIIRKEMDVIGGQEVTLTSLQEKETWEPTNQWSDEEVDIWFKTKLKNETELGLAVTHEAPMTKLLKQFVSSYRDLPKLVYQFQTKFRNETRAKSGIMRTREFIMKDLYSFASSTEDHHRIYESVKKSYENIFNQIGIGDKTFITYASGGMFSQFSHEFQTITDAGEDIVYVDEEKKIAINKEVYTDELISSLGLQKESLIEKKCVEVGNIFTLGTRFSDALGLSFTNDSGEKKSVLMGSYGIGPARVMGTVVETNSDDKGIIWPESIAPFLVHIVLLGDDESIREQAEDLYKTLSDRNIEVLFDDRAGVTSGQKFADADLIGIPYRVVISSRSIDNGGIEVKKRDEKEGRITTSTDFVKYITTLNHYV